MTANGPSIFPASTGDSGPPGDDALVARYARRLPRYTSYPAATHFSAGVTADDYARWLAQTPTDAPLSLYLHVPFCEHLCFYCGCHTTVTRRPETTHAYANLLRREIHMVAEQLGGERRPVSSIHWGGGTPTMLSSNDIIGLSCMLRYHFNILGTADIAMEIDPRQLTRIHVEAIAAIGVNRVSLGVQTFDPAVQKAINREQSFAMTEQAVGWLRRVGIDEINFDLLYGLPFQTDTSVETTIRQAAALRPARMSLFGYAHVPWMKKHQRMIPDDALPSPAERLRQYRTAAAAIEAEGYVPVGLDHFARPDDLLAQRLSSGNLHRNFQGYTADTASTLIGFGASAIGSFGDGYVQNAPDLKQYREAISQGHFATVRGYALAGEDRMRRAIIERLMCDLRVDLGAFDPSPVAFAPELEKLEALKSDGLVKVAGRVVSIPPAMRPFARVVCATFDTHLDPAQTQHSGAI